MVKRAIMLENERRWVKNSCMLMLQIAVKMRGMRWSTFLIKTLPWYLVALCFLFNNQSTVDQFVNPKYLRDIQSMGKSIDMYCQEDCYKPARHV